MLTKIRVELNISFKKVRSCLYHYNQHVFFTFNSKETIHFFIIITIRPDIANIISTLCKKVFANFLFDRLCFIFLLLYQHLKHSKY